MVRYHSGLTDYFLFNNDIA